LEWSYRLLSPELQRFFCRLSVFRGGWTVEAAQEVCKEPLALDYLERLREGFLALAEESEGEMRFRMLETLREFGQARLSAAEQETLSWWHAVFFMRLAEQAESHLSDAGQAAWLARLQAEHGNLCAALEWAVGQPRGGEAALRLCGALCRFWQCRGHLAEGRQWCARALRREGERTAVRAKTLNGAGLLAETQGEYGVARALLEESLAIRRQRGDRPGIAASLNNLGNLACKQGAFREARTLYEESLDICRQLDDRPGIARAIGNLGMAAWGLADLAAARAFHQEGLHIFRQLGDRGGIARSLDNLGIVAFEQRDYKAAHAFHLEALAIFRELEDRASMPVSLRCLARVVRVTGRTVLSAWLLGAAESLREEIQAAIPPAGQDQHEAEIAALRASLGEEGFRRAWEAGRALTPEQALAEASSG
jgi:non-specific serine/threonine protein kinase